MICGKCGQAHEGVELSPGCISETHLECPAPKKAPKPAKVKPAEKQPGKEEVPE